MNANAISLGSHVLMSLTSLVMKKVLLFLLISGYYLAIILFPIQIYGLNPSQYNTETLERVKYSSRSLYLRNRWINQTKQIDST